MLPEEKAREKIDRQLRKAGWDIVSRDEYIPGNTCAVKEALMQGNTESDYLLFIEDKAIAVLEAKRAENQLGEDVRAQAEGYARTPQSWYGLWQDGMIPLVYLSNGEKFLFKNLLEPDADYVELKEMDTPKAMLQIIGQASSFGALPYLDPNGLRDCQYRAEKKFEESIKEGKKKNLAILATGSGKTYLACNASYRLLEYTPVKRVLFLVDRNNLGKQAEGEFRQFQRTANGMVMSDLYDIQRLRKEENLKGHVIISTIQKLFAILTGQQLSEESEDAEDERNTAEEEKEDEPAVQLESNLKIPPDYFQLIIVDECHRSIYGKWKTVLDYFSDAIILGLTATPTPEAYAFFDNNIVENYTFDDSVVDGVNVSARVYRIKTKVTEHGGTIGEGMKIRETSRKTGKSEVRLSSTDTDYKQTDLDRSVVNIDQIREVLTDYKKAIYEDLYPEREKNWRYIPKTLIFAKDENHATQIVNVANEVFGEEFEGGNTPEGYVQKITYTCEDSNGLIRDLRTEKDFRIAVTVTLVATGTDVRPLEVVLFMKDVQSEVLYTQMKGRGCRVISDDKLREVTPNAPTKECFYIVDAVGVTEHDKSMPHPLSNSGGEKKTLPLEQLFERLAHRDVNDENLLLLRDYCSSIHRRYEFSPLFSRHLEKFIDEFNFAPRTVANQIQSAFDDHLLPPFVSPSDPNTARMNVINCLITNLSARRKLLEMKRGYVIQVFEDKDELLYAGFSKETARSFIDSFEKYLNKNKDRLEALRIIYNSQDALITHSMLLDLRDSLLAESRQFSIYHIWKNYKVLDENGVVEELDIKSNVNALTHLIQLVRFAYKKNLKLVSLMNGFAQRFSLYCGQVQRTLTEDQQLVMRRIAEYVINDGAITIMELNETDTDLWRQGVQLLGAPALADEMQALARILLRIA